MRVAYISPSTLPSRTANSIHVALQCEGLTRAGARVTLYAKRTVPDEKQLVGALSDAYGIDASGMRLVTYFSGFSHADSLRISILALCDMMRGASPEVILSRNLYASFALAVLGRRRLFFETHQLEVGFRKAMQRAIMTRPWVTTVAISNRLVECLAEHHRVKPCRSIVLHDAAPDGIVPVPSSLRRARLSLAAPAVGPWDLVCGYFGHLYSGRGIEIIEAMADARPGSLFLVYGGNDADVNERRIHNRRSNLHYMGHVSHPAARRIMVLFDVLLMPYQETVSISIKGHDTARWMSPMKMFEYLASGVPVISSDLPVLREVLRDGENCLLVPPDQPQAWLGALDRLASMPDLRETLSQTAHAQYLSSGNWTRRAELLLSAASTR